MTSLAFEKGEGVFNDNTDFWEAGVLNAITDFRERGLLCQRSAIPLYLTVPSKNSDKSVIDLGHGGVRESNSLLNKNKQKSASKLVIM